MKLFQRVLLSTVLVFSLVVISAGGVIAQDDMQFEEYAVTLAGEIAGTVVKPAGDGSFATVLMLHGFASMKDEVGDMYKRLAASPHAMGRRRDVFVRQW